MKRGGPQHPKVMLLAATLGLERYAAVGLLECLWHFTAQYAPRGDLGRYTDAQIAGAIGWQVNDAARLVDALVCCRLVDASPTDRLVVHDWHDHADQTVQRVLSRRGESFVTTEKKKRKASSRRLASELAPASLARGNGNGLGNGLGEGEREGEHPPPPSRTPRELTAAFETRFWPAYPRRNGRRDGRAEALACWLRLAPDVGLEGRMLRALAVYAKATEYPVDAIRWLKHRRWEDEADTGAPLEKPLAEIKVHPTAARLNALSRPAEVARG
jgi:hypothetical protein